MKWIQSTKVHKNNKRYLNGGWVFKNILPNSVTYNIILCGRMIKNNAFFKNNSSDKLLNFNLSIEYAFGLALFIGWLSKECLKKKINLYRYFSPQQSFSGVFYFVKPGVKSLQPASLSFIIPNMVILVLIYLLIWLRKWFKFSDFGWC